MVAADPRYHPEQTPAALGCASRLTAAEPPTRPNIVFVLADDLGPGDLGCYGGKIAPTPNLDRMAKEGTRFGRYYAAAPICSPSRCGRCQAPLGSARLYCSIFEP